MIAHYIYIYTDRFTLDAYIFQMFQVSIEMYLVVIICMHMSKS